MKKYSQLQNTRSSLRDMIPLDTPFALFIDPTNWCNFKCSFCPRNQPDFHDYAGAFRHMDYSLFEKICADLKQFPDKLKVLRLYYIGEPFLSPDFLRILKKSVDEDIAERIEITTNASLLTESISKAILDIAEDFSGTIYLRASIYSVDNQRHKKVTTSSIPVEKIYNNIRDIYRLREKRGGGGGRIFIYAKMLNTYDEESKRFLEMYAPITDEAALEEPMNWSGYDEKNLLSET